MRQERSRLIVELEAWLREQRAKLSGNTDTTERSTASAAGMRWSASSMTDGFACRTMLLSVSYGRSPWGEKMDLRRVR